MTKTNIFLCRLHLVITVIFYSPPSPSAKTTCIMLEKDFLRKYRKKICLYHIIKQCLRIKLGPKLRCLGQCPIIQLMVLTIIHVTLEVGQEWDRRAVSLSCTQIAQKVSKPISKNSNDSSNKHFKPVLVCCGFFQRHISRKVANYTHIESSFTKQFFLASSFGKQY